MANDRAVFQIELRDDPSRAGQTSQGQAGGESGMAAALARSMALHMEAARIEIRRQLSVGNATSQGPQPPAAPPAGGGGGGGSTGGGGGGGGGGFVGPPAPPLRMQGETGPYGLAGEGRLERLAWGGQGRPYGLLPEGESEPRGPRRRRRKLNPYGLAEPDEPVPPFVPSAGADGKDGFRKAPGDDIDRARFGALEKSLGFDYRMMGGLGRAQIKQGEAYGPIGEMANSYGKAALGSENMALMEGLMGAEGAAAMAGPAGLIVMAIQAIDKKVGQVVHFMDEQSERVGRAMAGSMVMSGGDSGSMAGMAAAYDMTKMMFEDVPVLGKAFKAAEAGVKMFTAAQDQAASNTRHFSRMMSAASSGDMIGATTATIEQKMKDNVRFGGIFGMIRNAWQGLPTQLASMEALQQGQRDMAARAERVGPYSGEVSAARAMAQVTRMNADIREARRNGGVLAEGVRLQANYEAAAFEATAGLRRQNDERIIRLIREGAPVAEVTKAMEEAKKAADAVALIRSGTAEGNRYARETLEIMRRMERERESHLGEDMIRRMVQNVHLLPEAQNDDVPAVARQGFMEPLR